MKISSFTITIEFYHDSRGTCCRNRKPERKKKKVNMKKKIIQVCVEEFDLNQEEVLTSLKKAVDKEILYKKE